MSDLPYEDRQKVIRATFLEHLRESLKDPGFRIELRAALKEDFPQLLRELQQEQGQSAPPPTQHQSAPQRSSNERVSAFDKFILGR